MTALTIVACQSPPTHKTLFDWTVGDWHGVRKDVADGSESPMTMCVESILDGRGQIRHLAVGTGADVYRGFAVQVPKPDSEVWAREYVNASRMHFAHLEGEGDADGSIWRSVSPTRTRESRLVSERVGPDHWRRTMSVSKDGVDWQAIWCDDLRRK